MKTIITLLAVVLFFVSCSRSISVQQAAGGGYKSLRSVR
jgi:hypothetical protein